MNDVQFKDIQPKVYNAVQLEAKAFERKKNRTALLYVIIVCSLLCIAFITTSWQTPAIELPIKEDLVEVTLDNSLADLGTEDLGQGEVQPLRTGDYAPIANEPTTTPTTEQSSEPEPANDPITDEVNNDDAPPAVKPTIPTKKTTTNNTTASTPTTSKPIPTVTTKPAVAAPTPKPRAIMRPGATGTGGNNSNTNNDSYSQGGGGGNKDQGTYNGKPGGTGTKLTNANLSNRNNIERLAEQSGTNYNGKVILKLSVDENGNASLNSASAVPANAASNDARAFARSLVSKMKFVAGADGRTATITLEFGYGQ